MFSPLITLLSRRLFNRAGLLFCAAVFHYAFHVRFHQGRKPVRYASPGVSPSWLPAWSLLCFPGPGIGGVARNRLVEC